MGKPWLTGPPPGAPAGVCQRNPQVCGPGRCIPRPSGYTCACDSGFRLSQQGTHCIGELDRGVDGGRAGGSARSPLDQSIPSVPSDVDECRRVPQPCAPGRCENAPGSFRCVCGPGFRAGPRATECLGEKSAPPGSRTLSGSRSCSLQSSSHPPTLPQGPPYLLLSPWPRPQASSGSPFDPTTASSPPRWPFPTTAPPSS